MKKVLINDIYQNKSLVNKNIILFGWVRNRRHSNFGVSFIDIYDGSSFNTIQGIIKKNIFNYTSEVLKLTNGCSIFIQGKVVYSIGKNQKYEIQIHKINVIGWIKSPDSYPIASKKHTFEYLRSIPHLRPRTNLIGAITRIRNSIFHAIHCFLQKKNYYWIPTPIITSLDSEGAGSMFRITTMNFDHLKYNKYDKKEYFKKDFFGKEAFLTVSGQLTAEAYACSMTKVYTFGPTFRAENSNTTRHLAEFWMLEVEEAFCNLDDIIKLSYDIIKHVIQYVLQSNTLDIEFFYTKIDKNIFHRLEKFLYTKIIQIEYLDAINILIQSKIKFRDIINYGIDLSSEHEKYLVNNYFKAPIIIKNFPRTLKAFYMKLNENSETVSAMDFLVPGVGEIIGGSEREYRESVLKMRISELGLSEKDYSWYIDLRRYGSVPHAGFGLGFERLLSYITGIRNVKDLIPFPRTVKHALC